MFSNLSPRWRKRVPIIVAAWALLLVAVGFFGSQSTVREQAHADEGRLAADEAVGVAASALAGTAFEFAVGPPVATECEIAPGRAGVDYLRTFEVRTDEPELALAQATAALSEHLETDEPARPEGWRFISADFVSVRLDVDVPGLTGSVSTGCRPTGADFGVLTPAERPSWISLAEDHPGLDAADAEIAAYGSVACAHGGAVETWWWDIGADALVPHTVDECG